MQSTGADGPFRSGLTDPDSTLIQNARTRCRAPGNARSSVPEQSCAHAHTCQHTHTSSSTHAHPGLCHLPTPRRLFFSRIRSGHTAHAAKTPVSILLDGRDYAPSVQLILLHLSRHISQTLASARDSAERPGNNQAVLSYCPTSGPRRRGGKPLHFITSWA